MPPKRLGRWTVLEPIGRGGQSRVYQALDTEGGALRALKHVATFTAQKRRRFVREVRRHVTLSDASARNIVPIIDHNLDEFEAGARNGYIVMPLAEATLETSSDLFVGRVELALQVFREILNGVSEAHKAGIVHRDIKPANVLSLDRAFRVPLLTDFGICYVKEEERLTLPAETVGARFFMAPEQEQGGTVDVDARADLYALGKLLHFMLSGRLLFREQLNRAFEQRELNADARYHRILDELLAKTVVEDREGRFSDIEALVHAVDKILGEGGGGSPAAIVPEDPKPRPGISPVETGRVISSFSSSLGLLSAGNVPAMRISFDTLRAEFRSEWEKLLPSIESSPHEAPGAALKLVHASGSAAGGTLAMVRLDVDDLVGEFKGLLEFMLRLGERRAGYVAIASVPFVPAGFLYMTACVASVHWQAWKTLRKLLRERFEWYYQSGRPLYDFGFQMAYFFHAEAIRRKATETHDLFRSVLSEPEYLSVVGVTADELLSTYVQTQMIHCLRAVQEHEGGGDGSIWADFGRFHAYRVLPLLDRVHNDKTFASGLASVFEEKSEVWLQKLNGRLEHIRENHFRGAPYFWDSVREYEPR